MVRFTLILLLVICSWNIASTLFASNDSHHPIALMEFTQSLTTANTTHSVATVQSQHENDENSCENEDCQFHRCHLGHCSFIVAPTVSANLSTWVGLRSGDLEEDLSSIVLSVPAKPPRV